MTTEEWIEQQAVSTYGEPLSEAVRTRLTWELACMERCGYALIFRQAAAFARALEQAEIPFFVSGVGAASLICYVLGITRTNPVRTDGCDLPPEAFWGNGDDGAGLCLAVSKTRFSSAWALLYDCTDTPDDSDAVTHIDKYSACLGKFTLWGLSGAFARKKKSARPKPFAMRVRSAAEKQCAWQPHRPDDIAQFPVTREELFAAFLDCGVDRQQAWSCAERVRKGKTWTQLPHEISPTLAAYCRTVRYLPSKAEIHERLLLQDALAETHHE